MKIIGKNGMGNILKIILQICFYIGIIILIPLPFLLQTAKINLNDSIIIIYPNGIILLIIVQKFIKLFESLKNNNPFCEDNRKRLKNTAIVALIGSCFWLFDLFYKIFFVKSYDAIFILTMIFLCILFLGVSIALYILAELIKEATEYKKENELTI